MFVASTPMVQAPSPHTAAAVAAMGLALVHLYAHRLRFLDALPRSSALSFAGGVSIAYVFVHALPELERAGARIDRRVGDLLFLESHVYVVALAGFVVYYGLERAVRRTDAGGQSGADPGDHSIGVFWLHVGAFGAYNGLIGYLLFHLEPPGIGDVGLFATAMGLHFLVNDYGLRVHHREAYHRYGRWLLAAAVVAGGGLGAVTTPDRAVLGALFAFLSGGIVLNVIKEELPPDRESRFSAFAVGAGGYAALLLLV